MAAGASAAWRRAFDEEAGKAMRALAAHKREKGGGWGERDAGTRAADSVESAAAAAVAATMTLPVPTQSEDERVRVACERLWQLRGKLADCVAHHVARLPVAAAAAALLSLGSGLIRCGEHRLALTECYRRCLDMDLLGAGAAGATTRAELVALEVQASFGVARCEHALAVEADGTCALQETPKRLLAAMALVRRGIELSLPEDELYWLVHDGSVHMATLAAPLMAAGLGALALESLLFASLAFEKLLPLCLPRHFAWRCELIALACEAYADAGKRSLALAFARRGLGEMEQLYALEKLEPIALPVESEAAYARALMAINMLVLKYDAALADGSDATFDAEAALGAFNNIESKLQAAVEALRASGNVERPGNHSEAVPAQVALFDAMWSLIEPTLQDMVAKLDEGETARAAATAAAAAGVKESAAAARAEGETSEAALTAEEELNAKTTEAAEAAAADMAAAAEAASACAVSVPLDLLVGFVRCAYQYERHELLERALALSERRAAAALACDAEPKNQMTSAQAEHELHMVRALRALDVAAAAPAEGVGSMPWTCGGGKQLDDAVATALAVLESSAAEREVLGRAPDLAADLAMRVWELAGAALSAVSPPPNTATAAPGDGSESAAGDALAAVSALGTLHEVLQAVRADDAVARARVAAALCVLLDGLKDHRRCEEVAIQALDHVIQVRGEEAERSAMTGGSGGAAFAAAKDTESNESALAGLQADLTALRFRGALRGSLGSDLVKARTRRMRVEREVSKQEEQAKAYGGLLGLQITANAKRLSEARRVPEHPAKEERRLANVVNKNPYEHAMLLVEMASLFPHDAGRAGQLLSQACAKAREASDAEEAIRTAAAEKTTPRGRVPAAPRVVARTAGAVVVGAPAFNLKSQGEVTYYAVYAKPLGSGLGVSLNDNGLAGCGELVPVDSAVRVHGLRPNEMYMFAVAAYDKSKRLVGDGIGASTVGVPALLPLPTLALWSSIGLAAARVGSTTIARDAFAQVTEKFLVSHDLSAPWDAHPTDEVEINAAALTSAPAATLRSLVHVLLQSAALTGCDGRTPGTSTNMRLPPFKAHMGLLRSAKLRLMALEVAAAVGDERLIEDAGLRVHDTLAPLRTLRHRANWLAKPLGRANIALQRCIQSKRGHSTVAASAAAAAYDLIEIYRTAGEADAVASYASITKSSLFRKPPDGVGDGQHTAVDTVKALNEYVAVLPAATESPDAPTPDEASGDALIAKINATLTKAGAEAARGVLVAAPPCPRTLEALHSVVAQGVREGRLTEVQGWIEETVSMVVADEKQINDTAAAAAEADEAARAQKYAELVAAREAADAEAAAAAHEAVEGDGDGTGGPGVAMDADAAAVAKDEATQQEAAAVIIQRGLRARLRRRREMFARLERMKHFNTWRVRVELLRSSCEMELCLEAAEVNGGPSFMLVSDAEAAKISEGGDDAATGGDEADLKSKEPSPELQLALRMCRTCVLAYRTHILVNSEAAWAARALTDVLRELFADGAAPHEARKLGRALEVASESLLAQMEGLRSHTVHGADGRPATAFSAASDAPPTEPWFKDHFAAGHMKWACAFTMQCLRRILDAGMWHGCISVAQSFNALTDDAYADKSLPLAMEAAEASGDSAARNRVRKRTEQLRRDKNLAVSALDDCRALWAQHCAAEKDTDGSGGAAEGHGAAQTARPLSRGSARGHGGGHVHAAVAAYGKAVEMLRLRTGKDARLLHVQALHELGDVHASLGDHASAAVAWSDAIDTLFGSYHATKDWRATLRALGASPIRALGLHGCLVSVCILVKVGESTYANDIEGKRRCCEFAAALVAATFECSIVHPQRLIDFADYVPVELWENVDVLDDPYLCCASKLIHALRVTAEVLLKSGDEISAEHIAQGEPASDALAALPVLSMLEHLFRFRAREAGGIASARAMRVRALCLLGRIASASAVLVALVHGDDVPWRGPMPGSRGIAALPATTGLGRPSPYRDDCGADHPDNAAITKFVAEAEIPVAVREAYGARVTANIQFARARWLLVAGTTARTWAVTDPASEDGLQADAPALVVSPEQNQLFDAAKQLVNALKSEADETLSRHAAAEGATERPTTGQSDLEQEGSYAWEVKAWGALVLSHVHRAQLNAPAALQCAREARLALSATPQSARQFLGTAFELACDRLLCESLGQLGRRVEAREACERALVAASKAHADRSAAAITEIQAHLALADGDIEAAIELLRNVRAAHDRMGNPGAPRTRCLLRMAAMHVDLGDAHAATAAARRAVEEMEELCEGLALRDSDTHLVLRRACVPGVEMLATAHVLHAKTCLLVNASASGGAGGGGFAEVACAAGERACALARTYPAQVDPALAASAYAALGAAKLQLSGEAGVGDAKGAARHLSAAVRITVSDGGNDRDLLRSALVQLALALLCDGERGNLPATSTGDSWMDAVGRAASCLKAAERAVAMGRSLLGASDAIAAGMGTSAISQAPSWALAEARESEEYAALRAASSGPAPAAASDSQLRGLLLRAGGRAVLKAGGIVTGLDGSARRKAVALHSFLIKSCEPYASQCCFAEVPLPSFADAGAAAELLPDNLVCVQWLEGAGGTLRAVYVIVAPGDDDCDDKLSEARVLRGSTCVKARALSEARRAATDLRLAAEAAHAAGEPLPPRDRQLEVLQRAVMTLFPEKAALANDKSSAVGEDEDEAAGDEGGGAEAAGIEQMSETEELSLDVVRQVEALLSPAQGLAAVANAVAVAMGAAAGVGDSGGRELAGAS